MINVICGWCRNDIQIEVIAGKSGDRNIVVCPACGRILPSSKKVFTKNPIGRKHIHDEWKAREIIN